MPQPKHFMILFGMFGGLISVSAQGKKVGKPSIDLQFGFTVAV